MINKRLTQTLLINPYIGPILAALNSRISEPIARKLSRQQLSSIYGPEANPDHRIEDIEAMFSLTRHNGGTGLVHKTCSYLIDRARFESRWYRALGQTLFLLFGACMMLTGSNNQCRNYVLIIAFTKIFYPLEQVLQVFYELIRSNYESTNPVFTNFVHQ